MTKGLISIPGVTPQLTPAEVRLVKEYQSLTLSLRLVDGEWEVKNNFLYIRGSMLDIARTHLGYLNEGN